MNVGQLRCHVEAVVVRKIHYRADPAKGREESFQLELGWLQGGTRYYCEDRAEWDNYHEGQEVLVTASPYSAEEIRFSDPALSAREVSREATKPAAPKAGIFGGKAAA